MWFMSHLTGQQTAAVTSHGSSDEASPQTPEEWVEKLVQEMSVAKDINEARARGHQFLSSFGNFVNQVSFSDSVKSNLFFN
jgi:hypothetical protein